MTILECMVWSCGHKVFSMSFILCTPKSSNWSFIYKYNRYDRLRLASGLKSVCTLNISIHQRCCLKSQSDLSECSNRRPFQILRSMADLLVRVRIRAYARDVIGHRFEKVRNDHRFGNWTPI